MTSCAVTPLAGLLSLSLCRQGGGRPALEVPQDWRDRCTRVGISCCPEKGVDQALYIYFAYDCGCVGYKLVSSLRRRGAAALQCPEHGSGRRRLSDLLLRVKAVLVRACPDLGPVVIEAHLLPGKQHAFDLWFPKWQIAAEVDGRQHFTGSYHGKAATQQYKQDRQLDALCQRKGLRLLRFHHAEDRQWGRLLQWGIKQVQQNPHCCFLAGTNSYVFEAARYPLTQ